MFNRKSLAGLAIVATLVTGTVALADTTSTSDKPKYLAQEEVAPVAPTPPTSKPLMDLLDRTGLGKPMRDARINIYGLIEGSYTYNFSTPTGDISPLRVFDQDHNELLLNQINLSIERTVDASKGVWDVGGKIEQTFGDDSRFTHSNGLTIYGTGSTGSVAGSNPEIQYDLTQAYLDLTTPVKGLVIRGGKWVTLLGYETILPTGNPLFSHSFLFANLPFTHTGVIANYRFNDEMGFQAGITRGWDQFDDNNNDYTLIGQYYYEKEKYKGYLNVITGRETTFGNGWRTVLDYWATYNFSDQIKLGINVDFGWEAQKDPVDGSTGIWYGVAGYASYEIDKMFTVNCRVEAFDDQDASAPATQGVTNVIYEATLGIAIKPMPNDKLMSNFMIRPEIRIDYADKATIDGGHYQTTAAIDAIFTF